MKERTAQDFAIEYAEYMAQGAETLIESMNALNFAIEMQQDDEIIAPLKATEDEARCTLRVLIYEFRKRRLQSFATQPAPAGKEAPNADQA